MIVYQTLDGVKVKRAYRSPHREKQAESTRQSVLDAAEQLFRELGWAPTTVAAVAQRAGVSAETVYARFGNKRKIAHELVIRAMRGPDRQTPFMQQQERASVLQQAGGAQIIDAFAADISMLLSRVAPILAVIRTAADGDKEMADLYRELQQARRKNLGKVAEALQRAGSLKAELSLEEAGDTIWSIVSPELWLLRISQLGCTPESNREWISATLQQLLLAPDPPK